MTVFGGIGFTAPWLLLGLLVLPILWLILRAVPPAPLRRRFPGVALLLGLTDDDMVSDRTPWWLLLLRMAAVAAMIVGLAGPILNANDGIQKGRAPLLLVVDGSWAGAGHWAKARQSALGQLDIAQQLGRSTALLVLSDPQEPLFQTAGVVSERVAALNPNPWQPNPEMIKTASDIIEASAKFDTIWISDGLEYEGREDLMALLANRGDVTVMENALTALALGPATYEDGIVSISALRPDAGPARDVTVLAQGVDPAGSQAILARAVATFEVGQTQAEVALALPSELRERVTRFTIDRNQSAGATTLVDDALRRREIALVASQADQEGVVVLNALHYLQQALIDKADVLNAPLSVVMPANPNAIVLADVATISADETARILEWVENGGTLVRFAGPRLAASEVSRQTEDPLMPVRLRAGGRTVGGAMSWGEPKTLAPFDETSPFFGLSHAPDEVTVSAQVVPQPDPTLGDRVIAQLSDGTPLVTRKRIGAGQVVLFHVTANAEWSNLPLSVLFVDMLERIFGIVEVAGAERTVQDDTLWQAIHVLDGLGNLDSDPKLGGVLETRVTKGALGPELPPGVYQTGQRTLARNIMMDGDTLSPATWSNTVTVMDMGGARERPLGGLLLATALILLMLDVIASLALSGRLFGRRAASAAAVGLLAFVLATPHADAQSQEIDDFALNATAETVLAHVITGDAQLDEVASAGLKGLSDALFFRTSIEPADPIGIDLEVDELAFFPILYWPITPSQPRPSAEAYAKLNAYLQSGGLIMFDTRDADLSRFGNNSPNGRKLQQLAAPLDIPRLEPLPEDHVLTRTFYLLQDFPGRHTSRDVWVEAAPPDAEAVEGMPFRNLNDGVTPVVIGGNDWASAWAVNDGGGPMLPIGRGFAGERQRELSYRFGINLIMHVLTGNYKSDQVHVPALLDRLGQ